MQFGVLTILELIIFQFGISIAHYNLWLCVDLLPFHLTVRNVNTEMYHTCFGFHWPFVAVKSDMESCLMRQLKSRKTDLKIKF